jgi:hypothetical protein
MGLLVEYLVIRLVGAAKEMSIAPGGFYLVVPQQGLSQFETSRRSKDYGSKVMTEIMHANGSRINARLDGAALYRVPHIARRYLLDMISCLFGVTNEQGSGLGGVLAGLQVVAQGIRNALGELYDRLFVSLADDNRLLFEKIHVTDTEITSLRDTQAGIGQEKDKRPVPEFGNVISHSFTVGEYLLNAFPVEQDQPFAGLDRKALVSLLKEGCLNTWIFIGGEKIQALYGRSVEGLRSRVHGCGVAEELFVGFFGERGINSHDVNEITQGKCVHGESLFTVPAVYELKESIYLVLHGLRSFQVNKSNVHYIRLELENHLWTG